METSRELKRLRFGRLSVIEMLELADWFKAFVRKHRRRSHQWCIEKLQISHRKFYTLLSISKWSKKVKGLVRDKAQVLSTTKLIWFANRSSWYKSARQLYNAIAKLAHYLAHRNRRQLAEKEEQEGKSLLEKLPKLPVSDPTQEKLVEYKDPRSGLKIRIRTKDPGRLARVLWSYKFT